MGKTKKRRGLRLIREKGRLRFVRRKKVIKFSKTADYSKVNWEKVDKILSSDRDLLIAKLQKDRENTTRTKEVLRILATGAVIGLSFAMPTLPMVVAPFIIDKNKYRIPRLSQTVKDLHRQKLVEIIHEDEATLVRVTKEGKFRALRYKVDEMKIVTQKKWDGLWRIVIFDIPEKERHLRDIFRQHLKVLRFYQLQKSVWVHAYPCMDEIEFLRQIYHVGFNATYIIAQQIEDDTALRSHFELDQ